MPHLPLTPTTYRAPARPDRFGRHAAVALLVVAVLWGAAIPFVALADLPASNGGRMVRALVYVVGAGVCHQRPDRSFASANGPWPVCARCAGLYLSAAVMGLAMGLWAIAGGRPAILRWRVWMLFVASPTAVSWLAERAGLLSTTNLVRFTLAVPLGAVAAMMLAAAAFGPASQKPEVD
jgi:uncharacterized membrane protein